ncbi:hypothetical protein [Bradyrhizobium sp. CCGUVB23]|uniref:hypothetical protein n=1 Tax=Bradyrhizobium sp. CCGUVB23 TaxID=2949630 RepID=UPI0020B2B62E|nr:hypothetical protein [Bradyrhizobium sp. CCGUVB23]MCP3460400.1 hypothetical protein [Bradyrhizobium sp. CCGUVB23]
MSKLQGTYVNDNIGAKLVIAQANDSNGQITSASISYNGHNYPATGHYHFKNSTGPTTVTVPTGLDDDAGYVALTLTSDSQEFKRLKSFGGLANFDAETIGLGGAFNRQ